VIRISQQSAVAEKLNRVQELSAGAQGLSGELKSCFLTTQSLKQKAQSLKSLKTETWKYN
jgi:hypothetical protein